MGRATAALAVCLVWGALLFPFAQAFVTGYAGSLPESELTSWELKSSGEEGIYYTSRQMTAIRGRARPAKDPEAIRYTLSVDTYELDSGEIPYRSRWKIRIPGLGEGTNLLEVTYVYTDGTEKTFDYAIINASGKDAPGLDDLDTDGDGLTDSFELHESFTDPLLADTDGNGVPDGEEDKDHDGLDNLTEQELGTFVCYKDSDYDDLDDGEEVLIYGTDPFNADTDGDTVSDYYEVMGGTDPLDPGDPADLSAVPYNEEQEFYDGMTVSIHTTLAADVLDSFFMYEIPYTYQPSSLDVPGMIGNGILLDVDGTPGPAEITITLGCSDYVEGTDYFLYYLDTSTGYCELVEPQEQDGDTITATLAHFSRYFVSSASEEEINETYGIDLIGKENQEALFDSYEEYLAAIYPDKAVYSVHVQSPDVRSTKVVDLRHLYAGHSWTSYRYTGDEEDLLLSAADEGLIPDGDTFGCIGYGGWLKAPEDSLVRITEAWEGSMKFPTAFRALYHEGFDNGSGILKYQSDGMLYEDCGQTPENMSGAWTSVPFVIDSTQYRKICEYAHSYCKQYCVRTNNCTTFMSDILDYAGIDNDINIRYKAVRSGPVAWYVWEAGSPGQAALSIREKYQEECVYVLRETGDTDLSHLKFTSVLAQKLADIQEEDIEKMGLSEPTAEELEDLYDAGTDTGGSTETDSSMDSSNGSFVVVSSPLAKLIGVPSLIFQGTDSMSQMAAAGSADMEEKAAAYRYFLVPETVIDLAREKYISGEYQFSSAGEYAERVSDTRSFKHLLWSTVFNYFYAETTMDELLDEYIPQAEISKVK
jgi:hypothetical protein